MNIGVASVISTWVRASNGRLYRDPVVRGELDGRRHFLVFDDSEDPELVMEAHSDEPARSLRDRAGRVAAALGLNCDVTAGPFRSLRCFGDDACVGPFLPAAAFFLDMRAPPPARHMRGPGSVQPSGGSCVVQSFGLAWG